MSSVAVAIPIYKTDFSPGEWLSLRQTFQVLGNHSIHVVYPEGLDLKPLQSEFSFTALGVDDKFFGSIKAYNNLVLSREFYELFTDYEYLLVCQSDVMLFKDELLKWTEKGYDYIGAPWINCYWLIWHNVLLKDGLLKAIQCLLNPRFYNSVGNGGLSLRKVSSFLREFDRHKTDRIPWVANEDYYWGIFAQKFNIPKFQEALQFAMETQPKKAMELNKGQLPFGVHAWEKFDVSVWQSAVDDIRKKLS